MHTQLESTPAWCHFLTLGVSGVSPMESFLVSAGFSGFASLLEVGLENLNQEISVTSFTPASYLANTLAPKQTGRN